MGKEIEVSKIKPDPNQPRKTFNSETLKLLAESILGNGQLYPIDIDEDYNIIDGERRWRAHKLAGKKEIECRIVKLKDKKDKLIRQLLSDLQDEEIPTAEKYEAIWNLYELSYPEESSNFVESSKQGKNFKINEFSKSIGKSESYIRRAFDYLNLKKEDPELMEGVAPALVGETKRLPPKERKEFIQEMKRDKERRERGSGKSLNTIDVLREKVRDKAQEIEVKQALKDPNFEKRLVKAGDMILSFRNSITESKNNIERTLRTLILCKPFIDIMDEKQKDKLDSQLDRFIEILGKGEQISEQIKEKL